MFTPTYCWDTLLRVQPVGTQTEPVTLVEFRRQDGSSRRLKWLEFVGKNIREKVVAQRRSTRLLRMGLWLSCVVGGGRRAAEKQ